MMGTAISLIMMDWQLPQGKTRQTEGMRLLRTAHHDIIVINRKGKKV